MAELAFDQIQLKNGDAWSVISLNEWLGIATTKRVEIIMQRGVRFLLQGQPIPSTEALESIMKNKRT